MRHVSSLWVRVSGMIEWAEIARIHPECTLLERIAATLHYQQHLYNRRWKYLNVVFSTKFGDCARHFFFCCSQKSKAHRPDSLLSGRQMFHRQSSDCRSRMCIQLRIRNSQKSPRTPRAPHPAQTLDPENRTRQPRVLLTRQSKKPISSSRIPRKPTAFACLCTPLFGGGHSLCLCRSCSASCSAFTRSSSRPCTTYSCSASASASSTWWLSRSCELGTTMMGICARRASRIEPEPAHIC